MVRAGPDERCRGASCRGPRCPDEDRSSEERRGEERYWRLALGWVIPFVALSLVGIKQERFLLPMWPLFLASALAGLLLLRDAAARTSLRRGERAPGWAPRAASAGLAVVLALALVSSVIGSQGLALRWRAGIFEAQAYIGAQPDATGVMLDGRIHLNGGYLLLNRNIPQLPFHQADLENRIFSHVAVVNEGHVLLLERNAAFEEVARFDDVRVFRRVHGLAGRAE
mgnify:CR=1 FL=1